MARSILPNYGLSHFMRGGGGGGGGGGAPVAPSSAVWGWTADGSGLSFNTTTNKYASYTDQIAAGGTGLDFVATGSGHSTLRGTPWAGLDLGAAMASAGDYIEITGVQGGYHYAALVRRNAKTIPGIVSMGTSASNEFLGVADGTGSSSRGGNATSGRIAFNGNERAAYPIRSVLRTDSGIATAVEGDLIDFAIEDMDHGTVTPQRYTPFQYPFSHSGFAGGLTLLGLIAFTDWSQRADMHTYIRDAVYAGQAGKKRFWRFRCTLNDGDISGRVAISELEFRDSGGSDLSGTAKANIFGSSYLNSANREPFLAFDGSTSTIWVSDFSCTANAHAVDGEWLMYDFGEGANPAVASMAVTAIGSQLGLSPRDLVCESSINGRDWTTEFSSTGETGWSANETRVFT